MYFKKLFTLLVFVVCASVVHAQALTTNIVVNGTTNSLTVNIAVAPTAPFVSNGSKLWMAIVQGQQVYFYSDTEGFVPYSGGLAQLLSAQPTEAPAVRAISKSTEVVYITGWNTRSILGSDIYVGYGTTFADVVKAGRYKKIYTFVERFVPVRLDELLGRMTLNYFGNLSKYIPPTDVVYFSENSLVVDDSLTYLQAGNATRTIVCRVYPYSAAVVHTHLCAIGATGGSTTERVLAFTLSRGTISNGAFKNCTGLSLGSSCVAMLTNPDGGVSGGVEPGKTQSNATGGADAARLSNAD